jgi:S1-C subfamily serine protease
MSEPITANSVLTLSRQLQQLAGSVADSVVSVRSHGRPIASGFAWKPGLIVTASDPLEADDEISVIAGRGRAIQAQLAGRDPTTDIAVLRLAEELPATTPMTPSQEVEIGQIILAVGRGGEGAIAKLGCVSIAGGAWQGRRGGRMTG